MSDVEFGNSLHEVCNELLAIPIRTIQRLSFNIPNAASRLPLSMSHATAAATSPGTSRATCGKAGREKIASRRRFPIQHLSGAEYTWEIAYHQPCVERLKGNSARRADRFLQRARRDESKRQRFDCDSQTSRVREILFRNHFTKQPRLYTFDMGLPLKMRCHCTLAARPR